VKNNQFVAAIRANHPSPPQCKLFYFEVEIMDKGDTGYDVNLLASIGSILLRVIYSFYFQKNHRRRILHQNSQSKWDAR